MGYSIISPTHSFVKFGSDNTVSHCVHGDFTTCLPVYAEDDIAFQFVVQADTPEEADALCNTDSSGIDIGIVQDCDQEGFTSEFTENPERYKISPLQVLYNWSHGVPGMLDNIAIGECFNIRVVVNEVSYCTGCFQRISDPCFTSVVEYGNDENFAGFNYCGAGEINPGNPPDPCDPETYSFFDKSTLTIPYTASLQDRFGPVPTVQVWVYVDGVLTNVGVVANFDAMPPTLIYFDFGGPSSGIVIIK